MLSDAFKERERALEEEFFHRVNKRLTDQLRQSMAEDKSLDALATATGLQDRDILLELLSTGISAESLVAMTLAPLVLVAWSDGELDDKERLAIASAVHDQGILKDSPAGELLEEWLSHCPGDQLFETWKHYTESLRSSLQDKAQADLRKQILARCASVAAASGGVLGLGRVSPQESQVLKDIESALNA